MDNTGVGGEAVFTYCEPINHALAAKNAIKACFSEGFLMQIAKAEPEAVVTYSELGEGCAICAKITTKN